MKSKSLLIDILIIIASIVLAMILVYTNTVVALLTSTKEIEILGIFFAGFFFTSVFSTAPAIVTLGEIAQVNSLLLTAGVGALGAVCGDLIIFRFVKDRLTTHVMEILKQHRGWKRVQQILKLQGFRFFTFLIGGLIIASPLPDELGVGLWGFSRLPTPIFIILSYIFNFLGILMIGFVAKSLM